MPRTKKTPSSLKPGSTATKGPNETPKGSGPSVAPSLEERVAALEKVVTRLALGIGDFISGQAEHARLLWEENRFFELTSPLNEETREAAFEAWNDEHFAEADAKAAKRADEERS